MNSLSPEVHIHFVPAESLELILPLVKVLQLLLQTFPKPDANLGVQVAVFETLRNSDKVYDLVLEREGIDLFKHGV